MFGRVLKLISLVCAATLCAPLHDVAARYIPRGKALVTHFTGSVGAGGVALNRYPTNMYIPRFQKKKRVYPGAVHTSFVSQLKFAVLEVTAGSRRSYVHIVDECADGDCHANSRHAEKKRALLVDLHASAWRSLGLGKPGRKLVRYRKVGTVTRENRAMWCVLPSDGRKGYVPRRWK
jgi:hypothetical protein